MRENTEVSFCAKEMDKGGEEGRKLKREEKYRKVRRRQGVKEVEETERMDCMHVVVDRYLV